MAREKISQEVKGMVSAVYDQALLAFAYHEKTIKTVLGVVVFAGLTYELLAQADKAVAQAGDLCEKAICKISETYSFFIETKTGTVLNLPDLLQRLGINGIENSCGEAWSDFNRLTYKPRESMTLELNNAGQVQVCGTKVTPDNLGKAIDGSIIQVGPLAPEANWSPIMPDQLSSTPVAAEPTAMPAIAAAGGDGPSPMNKKNIIQVGLSALAALGGIFWLRRFVDRTVIVKESTWKPEATDRAPLAPDNSSAPESEPAGEGIDKIITENFTLYESLLKRYGENKQRAIIELRVIEAQNNNNQKSIAKLNELHELQYRRAK